VRTALRAACLGLLAAALYLPSLKGNFLLWDDQALVQDNPVAGLPLDQALSRAFARPAGTTWWPLRDLSYALDHSLWGFNPLGFHVTNLLLGALAASGLYLVARRRFGEGTALAGALLFAVHPIHAEAVAWISGRKDLLCAFFLLVSWGFLDSCPETRGRRRVRLVGGLMAYLAACLSKTAALPFPLAWWALDRILPPEGRRWSLPERLPFLLAMGGFAWGQASVSLAAGAAGRYQPDAEGLHQALLTPLGALMDQVGALLLPLSLAPAYPQDAGAWGLMRWVCLGVCLLAVFRVWKDPGMARVRAGLVWTLAFFLPVINLGLATSTPRADRYAFLPSMGFCLAAGAVLATLRFRQPLRRLAVPVVVSSLALLAFAQGRCWASDGGLWAPALRRQPRSFIAAGNLASARLSLNLTAEARRLLDRLKRIDPASPIAHHQLGHLLLASGETSLALLEYAEACRLYREGGKGRAGVAVPAGYGAELGLCLSEMADAVLRVGDVEAALALAESSVREAPSNGRILAVLAHARSATAYAHLLSSQQETDERRREGLMSRAESLYRAMRPEEYCPADRINFAALLKRKAAAAADAGRVGEAYAAVREAAVLLPEDLELRQTLVEMARLISSGEEPRP